MSTAAVQNELVLHIVVLFMVQSIVLLPRQERRGSMFIVLLAVQCFVSLLMQLTVFHNSLILYHVEMLSPLLLRFGTISLTVVRMHLGLAVSVLGRL